MKRDFDLVRAILKDVEDIPPGTAIGGFTFEGRDKATVSEHAMLVYEAGFIKATVIPLMSGTAKMNITGLTWSGHEFLDSIRDATIWEKVKAIAKPAGAMTFPLITEIAASLIKAKLGTS